MKNIHSKKGVTLMEIIVVMIIIGILALFALPNVPTARNKSERKACIGNLWMIKLSKDQWALDESKITGSAVQWTDIVPNYLEARPECPTTQESSSYTLNSLGSNPTCVKGSDLEHNL